MRFNVIKNSDIIDVICYNYLDDSISFKSQQTIVIWRIIKVKWLIVINIYLPERVGGTVVYLERFIAELIKSGHEVTLLTATNRKDHLEYEKVNNLEIYRVYNEKGSVGALRFKDRELLTQKMELLLSNNNFDVVNIHTASLLNLKLLRERKKKYNFKLISTVHAVQTYEILFDYKKYLTFQATNYKELLIFPLKFFLMYIFEYYVLKYADGVVVMSEYVKKTIKMFFGNKFLDKILVTGIGVSPIENLPQVSKQEARKKLGLAENETIFITVRRLVPRMGYFNLIKAFNYVKNDSSRLLIIGQGQLYHKLDKYIKKLNLKDRVNLLGFIENDLLHYYYCAADCFILPTEQLEGFGIVTIEALNYNLPVIGTPKGATPEILSKFDANLITKSHKSEDIAEKIEYYLTKQKEYNMTDYKSLVNIEYNWQSIINKIVRFIEECELESISSPVQG